MASGTRRRRTAAIIVAGLSTLGAIAACSDGDDEVTADPTTTEATTTTSSNTTTTEPATTESTPTTLDDEAAIRELHEYFFTSVVVRDEREVSLDEQVSLLEDVTVDPLLTRAVEARQGHYQRGEYAVTPPADTNVISVEVEGSSATVVDCFLDSGVLYAADGTVIVPADELHELIEVEYEKRGEKWYVKNYIAGDEQCDPES